MNTPRGYNPIGQSAPGLPRHDAPLPGHVPGTPGLPLGGADPDYPAGPNPAYSGPGLPQWCTAPVIRIMFFLWTYLTAPVEAALYPIAGAAGLAGAGLLYGLAALGGGGYDTRHSFAWAGCFIGVVALMRTDTRIAATNPGYLALRQWLRLALGFAFMVYISMHEQGEPLGRAILVAAIFTVILHFVLRSRWLRFVWHTLQKTSWMRDSVDSPLPNS